MELNNFRIFLTVVEEMSFTKAANKLFVTQQALSGSIKRLEDTYRVTLFQRRPTLKLTSEGEAMVSFARQMIDVENAMTNRFADMTEEMTGILRLGMPVQRLNAFMPAIWNRFHDKHPNISVRYAALPTKVMVDEVIHNDLDMTLAPNVTPSSNLTLRLLVEESSFFMIHEDLLRQYYPIDWKARIELYKREGVDPMDLKKFPLILPPITSVVRKGLDAIFYVNHAAPNLLMESPAQNVIVEIGSYGKGAALITPLTASSYIKSHGALPDKCHVFKVKGIKPAKWYVVYRSDVQQPAFAMAMADAIEEAFAEYGRELEELGLD